MISLLLFAVALSLIVFELYLRYRRIAKVLQPMSGPPRYPVIGNLLTYLGPPEKLWDVVHNLNKDYYPIYKTTSFKYAVINICNPDDAEVLLSSTQHIEKSVIYDLLHAWFGTGLLTSTGEKWHERRKILTPAFHFNVLKKYIEIISENSESLVASLKQQGESVQSLMPLITEYTLNVICEAAMGIHTQGKQDSVKKYREAVYKMGDILLFRLLRPWLKSNWVFRKTEKGREQKKLLQTLHGFTTEIIRERKEYHDKTNGEYLKTLVSDESSTLTNDEVFGVRKRRLAMLDLMIAAHKEGRIDEDGMREEVDTFTFEGHDTSAMAICFALLLIAEHKDVQDKARAEVNKVLEKSNGKIGMEELQRFNYLERVLKESLRLYPSVPFISRNITQDLQLKKYLIPKGTLAHIYILDLHRDPNFWSAPDKFDPDRFLPENVRNRHPFCYIPFSAGSRNCIGQKFAMMELKCIIAHLLHEFYLEPIDLAHEVRIFPDLVLRPARPIHVKLVPIH